ncbi:hypothetical protein NQ318_008292 [Aromia moschata]|uniref:Mos1 transposase HTH domain-containing protein n=1 Tax=Aromia moschata TaxID=1265417 RepID=A0AAV8Y527_9CUCU|nr:hypothetical protein NQ318_008292 [Aromia moschata]
MPRQVNVDYDTAYTDGAGTVNLKFLVKLWKTFTEAYAMLKEVYGNECLSHIQVFEWFKRFKEGREMTEDDPRSGQPLTSKTDENIEKIEQQTTYACLPYVAGVTDKLKKTLSKKNIGVRFRTVKKIQQVLPSNKDPVPRLLTKGVYELKCTCGKSYIGQTGRSIQCRIKEHQRHTRLGNTDKSAIAEHVHTNENHKIDYENIRDKTTRYYPRIIRESLEIMKNNNNFNGEDGYRLSNTWRLAIPRTSDLECHGQPSSTDMQPNSRAKVYNEEQKTTTPVFRNLL